MEERFSLHARCHRSAFPGGCAEELHLYLLDMYVYIRLSIILARSLGVRCNYVQDLSACLRAALAFWRMERSNGGNDATVRGSGVAVLPPPPPLLTRRTDIVYPTI